MKNPQKKRNFLVQLFVNLFMGLIGAREVDENGFPNRNEIEEW